MVQKCFHPKCPTSSSPESISCPHLRSTTSLLSTPRSTTSNKTSPLTPPLIGGLVVIGILALLCVAGVGFTLHFHYCRWSDCSICSAIMRFTRSMRTRSIPGSYPQALAELLIELLIKMFLRLVTTILYLNKRSGTHTQKHGVTGYIHSDHPFRTVECRLGHPFLSSTSTDRKTQRRQCQTLWSLSGGQISFTMIVPLLWEHAKLCPLILRPKTFRHPRRER